MRHKFPLAFVAAIAAVPLGSASAQVAESGYSLPLVLAMKAATKRLQPARATVIRFPPLSLTRLVSSSSRPRATTRRSSPARQPSARHTRS